MTQKPNNIFDRLVVKEDNTTHDELNADFLCFDEVNEAKFKLKSA